MNATRRILFLLLVFILPFSAWSQTGIKPLKDLVDTVNSAWPAIEDRAGKATNKVTVLPSAIKLAGPALLAMQNSTNEPLPAVIYHTGGILVDDGWIRILGSGDAQFKRSLLTWNKNKTNGKAYTLVADDAVGGYFLINGGELGTDTANVYYFSPRTLKYKSLEMNYPKFLDFCFNGDLAKFYAGFRWKTWRQDVKKLDADEVFIFIPFLWNPASKNIENTIRKIIPAEQKYFLTQQEIQKKQSIK